MLGEIALLIKGLDTAIGLVKAGLDRKKDIEGMASEIHGFFESKQAVEAKISELKKGKDKYQGSALEEAIAISEESRKIKEMMVRIGKAYSLAGKSPEWQQIQRNAANIQKERDFQLSKSNRKKIIQDRKDAEFYVVLKYIFGVMLILIGIGGLVFVVAMNSNV